MAIDLPLESEDMPIKMVPDKRAMTTLPNITHLQIHSNQQGAGTTHTHGNMFGASTQATYPH